MHMEIIAAAGAFADRNQSGKEHQKEQPDTKQRAHDAVGGGNLIGNYYGGNIHKDRGE